MMSRIPLSVRKLMTRIPFSRYLMALGLAAMVLTGAVFGVKHLFAPATDLVAPYAYETGTDTPSDATSELVALIPGANAAVIELRVAERASPIAIAQVLNLPDQGDLIVGWQSEVAEPILRSDISSVEELALVTALRKYLPENSTVLAMPALSARLRQFTQSEFPLADEDEALRIPAQWAGRDEAVAQLEVRWHSNGTASSEEGKDFATFADALLAEDIYGSARLQVLAGAKDTFIVLHIRDIFDLGLSVPDSIPVEMRNFPAGGQVHDNSRAVKDWARDQGYDAYALQRQSGGALRAYYLSDTRDKNTLVGQLLPFNTARIGFVPGTRLVFQTGGYWVYRLQQIVSKS